MKDSDKKKWIMKSKLGGGGHCLKLCLHREHIGPETFVIHIFILYLLILICH